MPASVAVSVTWLLIFQVLSAFAVLGAESKKPSAGARKSTPRRDPPHQLFRVAPMAEASRTIAIPVSRTLHIAFDTEFLRTHTAWRGAGLNLYGPPYHGGKTPFLCTTEGTRLWTMPPLCPWSVGTLPDAVLPPVPPGARFDGLSTQGGRVTLLYTLAGPDNKLIDIRESAASGHVGGVEAIVRQFEIGPHAHDLWFLAHAEMGKLIACDQTIARVAQTHGFLVAAIGSGSGALWQPLEATVEYEVPLNIENEGDSDIRRVRESGRQSRLYVRIPASPKPVRVEILSAVLESAEQAAQVAASLQRDGDAFAVPSRANDGSTIAARDAKRVAGDLRVPRRFGGDEFYRIESFPLPKEIQLQATGMDWLTRDDLAVCTWLGEIYVIENATGPVQSATYRRFAAGLNEPLGLKVVGGDLYVVQKGELTRIRDTDRDGEADLLERINADWGYSGNYHAFAFGPVIDAQQNIYAFICGQRGRWEIPYVGWCVRINPRSRKLEGVCSGLRAPNGYGLFGPDGDLFIADNQGNWVGASKLNHLRPGRFYGYPSGRPAPKEQYERPIEFVPPALWLPRKLSPSASGFVAVEDERFGPFRGQMLIGDFQNAVVLRAFLEKVEGEWQGAVWPFAKGFLSGVNRLVMGADGMLYVGGLKNSAWPAAGVHDYSLERVSFTGKVPFEVREVRAKPDGFELTLTLPVERAAAEDLENYSVAQHTYKYHSTYGSPEIDHDGKENSSTEIKVTKAAVSADGLTIRLTLQGWRAGYVTMIQMFGIKSASDEPLWHDTFYYTLNQIPRE